MRDQRVPLAELWGGTEELADRIAGGAAAGLALERAVLARRPAAPAGVIPWLVARLRAGDQVAVVADAAGLSPRQLLRLSNAAFGYGPKTLARVLRVTQALELARAGRRFADVAATTGFADQAHLAREVKAMTGLTLRGLVGPAQSGAKRSTPLPSGSRNVA